MAYRELEARRILRREAMRTNFRMAREPDLDPPEYDEKPEREYDENLTDRFSTLAEINFRRGYDDDNADIDYEEPIGASLDDDIEAGKEAVDDE